MVTPFDAWRKKTAPLTQGEQATFIVSKRVPPERDERIEGSAHVIDLVRIKIRTTTLSLFILTFAPELDKFIHFTRFL
jgi:hypothetical protein